MADELADRDIWRVLESDPEQAHRVARRHAAGEYETVCGIKFKWADSWSALDSTPRHSEDT